MIEPGLDFRGAARVLALLVNFNLTSTIGRPVILCDCQKTRRATFPHIDLLPLLSCPEVSREEFKVTQVRSVCLSDTTRKDKLRRTRCAPLVVYFPHIRCRHTRDKRAINWGCRQLQLCLSTACSGSRDGVFPKHCTLPLCTMGGTRTLLVRVDLPIKRVKTSLPRGQSLVRVGPAFYPKSGSAGCSTTFDVLHVRNFAKTHADVFVTPNHG